VCDPKCSHFKVSIHAPYFRTINCPNALRILKFSENKNFGQMFGQGDHLKRNQQKPKQTPALKHTK
jgi:hypothetical protein